jgi:hypothetical protein
MSHQYVRISHQIRRQADFLLDPESRAMANTSAAAPQVWLRGTPDMLWWMGGSATLVRYTFVSRSDRRWDGVHGPASALAERLEQV